MALASAVNEVKLRAPWMHVLGTTTNLHYQAWARGTPMANDQPSLLSWSHAYLLPSLCFLTHSSGFGATKSPGIGIKKMQTMWMWVKDLECPSDKPCTKFTSSLLHFIPLRYFIYFLLKVCPLMLTCSKNSLRYHIRRIHFWLLFHICREQNRPIFKAVYTLQGISFARN